jgi:hypothetical protein
VGIITHMEDLNNTSASTYIKITGISLTEKIVLATHAAQANVSLSAYCLESIRMGEQVREAERTRVERKAVAK